MYLPCHTCTQKAEKRKDDEQYDLLCNSQYDLLCNSQYDLLCNSYVPAQNI